MDSPARQVEMKFLIDRLQEKLKQIETARRKDVPFEEKKKLFLEIKHLSTRLQSCLENSNVSAPQIGYRFDHEMNY